MPMSPSPRPASRSAVPAPWAVAALALLTLWGCMAVERRSVYAPRYLRYDELRRPVEASEPGELSVTGKIYVKDSFIYVNEISEGIHVIDNTDPANPVQAAFIPIPGNVDMAIRGSILYADSYVDLVAIDISDPTAAVEVARIEDAFPYPDALPIDVGWYPGGDVYQQPDPEVGIVVGWDKTGETIVVYNPDIIYALDGAGGAESGDTGTGGSMARFTVVGDYLYALHMDSILLVDIATPDAPRLCEESTYVGWNIETIFPYEDKLFIGSTTGMFIYDNSAPPVLTMLSQLEHVTSCDPVVVSGDRAYVTLRAGSSCGGGENALLVVNVEDPTAPETLMQYGLDGPYGLAADGAHLYVCDGVSGLKVFDVSEPLPAELPVLATVEGFETFDVIVVPPLAFVVGPNGLYEYDTSGLDGAEPVLEPLGQIAITPPVDEPGDQPPDEPDGGTSDGGREPVTGTAGAW